MSGSVAGAGVEGRLHRLSAQLCSGTAAVAAAAAGSEVVEGGVSYYGRDYAAARSPVKELAPAGLLKVHSLNHVSKETEDVGRLVDFYTNFLGFVPLRRPPFPFGGAWLFLPPCTAMHIILKDPDPAHNLPEAPTGAVAGDDPQRESFHPRMNPNARYHPIGISRGHHYAFRVTDIKAAEQRLIEAGIVYRKNTSPPNFLLTAEGEQVKAPAHAAPVSQIFFFDPDGNGVEIGNFAPVQPGFAPPLAGLPPVLVTGIPQRPPRPLSAVPPLIDVHSLNHCARETPNVERVTKWYCDMLGFRQLDRPAIPFDGSWLYMPPSTALHIIHTRDDWPRLPEGAGSDSRIEKLKDGRLGTFRAPAPPIGVRRSHHLAFRVLDIAEAEATLNAHGVEYDSATVPNTDPPVVQLFLFDCDGNGVEIGNFDEALPTFDPELTTMV